MSASQNDERGREWGNRALAVTESEGHRERQWDRRGSTARDPLRVVVRVGRLLQEMA